MPCLRDCGGGEKVIRQEPDTLRSGSVGVQGKAAMKDLTHYGSKEGS
jgi:hypothetical protein